MEIMYPVRRALTLTTVGLLPTSKQVHGVCSFQQQQQQHTSQGGGSLRSTSRCLLTSLATKKFAKNGDDTTNNSRRGTFLKCDRSESKKCREQQRT